MYSSCIHCERAVKLEIPSTSSVTKLVDIKSKGGFIHANLRFFHLIQHIETYFSKHCFSQDVFDSTVEEVFSSYNFSFPCKQHASQILSYAIIYDIRLRMRQTVHQENFKMTQKFVVKKKLSKLTNQ